MEISSAIEEYLSTRQNSLAIKTYRWYEQFLGWWLQWCTSEGITDLSQVTASDVAKFVNSNPGEADNTRHHRAQIVKTFLRWCAEDDEMGVRKKMIDRIEMPKVEQPEVEIFSRDDIRKLFAACDYIKNPNPHRNRALLWMLLDTGVRASELCFDAERPQEATGLRMDCLFLGRGEDESYITVMGKGRKARSIRLGKTTTLAVRKYLNRERGKCDSPYVFLSSRGENNPLSVRMLQQLLADLGYQAGVDNTHPHRFRHTFAVNQLLAGTSDLVLMKLMGHSSLESTKIYVRAMSQLQARLAAISIVDHLHQPRGGRRDK